MKCAAYDRFKTCVLFKNDLFSLLFIRPTAVDKKKREKVINLTDVVVVFIYRLDMLTTSASSGVIRDKRGASYLVSCKLGLELSRSTAQL